VRCAASSSTVCAPVRRCAIRGASGYPRAAANCATPSRSASDPPRRPTGRCLATGRATWSSAAGPARWEPWSSATICLYRTRDTPTHFRLTAVQGCQALQDFSRWTWAHLADLAQRAGPGGARSIGVAAQRTHRSASLRSPRWLQDSQGRPRQSLAASAVTRTVSDQHPLCGGSSAANQPLGLGPFGPGATVVAEPGSPPAGASIEVLSFEHR
jgi:hypothetical protein